jgi:putative acetyltransferase
VAEDVTIRAERSTDYPEIREVHAQAFGDGGLVAELVDALRAAEAGLPPLAFVATIDDRIAGHVMLTASRLDASRQLIDVYVLSPLGVRPEFQRIGVGTRLVSHARSAADAAGVPLVFLEGSPGYYGKRGFERADAMGFRSPSLRIPPPAFQVARLSGYQPWMNGTLVYADAFWALDCVGLRAPEKDLALDEASPNDLRHLQAAIKVAGRARANGNHPFGAVLAVGGEVVLEAENTVVTGRDRTGHAEAILARLASAEIPLEQLTSATLYTSTEPCAMCAGAIYWAGIGRVVYGLAETELITITGSDEANLTLALPCREVFARGQRQVTVLGPLLADAARAVHDGFWRLPAAIAAPLPRIGS